MLSEKQISIIRGELDHCKRPLFFFHDDPDGLCSFIQMYNYIREGKGVVVKSTPRIDMKFLRHVLDYGPDKVFILDIAIVDQEFIDAVDIPIVWIDHHEPLKRQGVSYFNPRIKGNDNVPISALCYYITRGPLWVAAVGAVSDWYIPNFMGKFMDEYPDLIQKKSSDPADYMFSTELGKLIRIFSFNMKGKSNEVMKSVKVLTRIKNPDEILKQSTPKGQFLYRRYEKVNEVYEALRKKAKAGKGDFLVFVYPDNKISLTKDLSNEMLYKHPDKIIVIGREKDDEVKISIRSSMVVLPPIVKKALEGIKGYGGGHEHACGTCVKKDDFKKFLSNMKAEVSKIYKE